uniref:Uncharacterized protein n=1 Tax=Meloidogyne incognita TaxID=6306 RepID=A0A914NPQ3_MELIC
MTINDHEANGNLATFLVYTIGMMICSQKTISSVYQLSILQIKPFDGTRRDTSHKLKCMHNTGRCAQIQHR